MPVQAVEHTLDVAPGQSYVLQAAAVERVAVADPKIADVVVLPYGEILVNGKTAGVTSLLVWTKQGRRTYQVHVNAVEGLKSALSRIAWASDITVTAANGALVLQARSPSPSQQALAERSPRSTPPR